MNNKYQSTLETHVRATALKALAKPQLRLIYVVLQNTIVCEGKGGVKPVLKQIFQGRFHPSVLSEYCAEIESAGLTITRLYFTAFGKQTRSYQLELEASGPIAVLRAFKRKFKSAPSSIKRATNEEDFKVIVNDPVFMQVRLTAELDSAITTHFCRLALGLGLKRAIQAPGMQTPIDEGIVTKLRISKNEDGTVILESRIAALNPKSLSDIKSRIKSLRRPRRLLAKSPRPTTSKLKISGLKFFSFTPKEQMPVQFRSQGSYALN